MGKVAKSLNRTPKKRKGDTEPYAKGGLRSGVYRENDGWFGDCWFQYAARRRQPVIICEALNGTHAVGEDPSKRAKSPKADAVFKAPIRL